MIREETLRLIQTESALLLKKFPQAVDYNAHQIADLLISFAAKQKEITVEFMKGFLEKDADVITDKFIKLYSNLGTTAAACMVFMETLEKALGHENKKLIISYTSDGNKVYTIVKK